MNQLNLLPWRQHARKIKKLRLTLGAAFTLILSLIILMITHHEVYQVVSHQDERNDFIRSEISKEQAVLAALKKDMQAHFIYEEKIRAIINIKKTSYNTIRLLNILPVVSSSSISILSVSKTGNLITITGKAQSNALITRFMDSIASQTTIFNAPNLATISNDKSSSKETGQFEIRVLEKDIT